MNRSRTVSDADVKRNLRALQKQITRDFEPAWGWGANLRFEATKFDMKMVIRDHSKGGDLGFHIEGGKPVGYIYAKDDIEDAGEYTSTLSHELLEMIADPNVNLYANGPFPSRADAEWDSSLSRSAIWSRKTTTRLTA